MTTETLWDQTIRLAERESKLNAEGKWLVSREELPAEMTPLGLVRWYLHPNLDDRCTRALYFFELEIPVGSRSGRLQHQGGIVHLVVEGQGHTNHEGVDHPWERYDVIGIPPRVYGNEFQHFNSGPIPVRMMVGFPNYDSALGPALGWHFRVVEPAPEYEQP